MTSTIKVKARKLKKDEKIDPATSKKVENVVRDDNLNKKIKTRKIHLALSNVEERKLDRETEREDNMSVAVMVIILAVCFVVGILLGYFLYKIAITGTM